jgi:transcription elongation factor GreA
VGIIPFTKQGLINLKLELEEVTARRPAAVETLKRGREMGDLSENGLYKAARMELGDIDRQIRHLTNLIAYGKVFEPKDNIKVQLGHLVTISADKTERAFRIVGEYEADPKQNKISLKSPIGHNLMGRRVGDKIDINTPQGKNQYKILKIAE